MRFRNPTTYEPRWQQGHPSFGTSQATKRRREAAEAVALAATEAAEVAAAQGMAESAISVQEDMVDSGAGGLLVGGRDLGAPLGTRRARRLGDAPTPPENDLAGEAESLISNP